MRPVFAAALLLAASLTWGETQPPLISHSLWDELAPPARTSLEWAIVAVGGVGGVGGAVWGLGSALSRLSDPGGPPLGNTITGLAWSTVALAAAGVALDDLLNAR